MPLPDFWRRPSFSVSEVAELVGTLETTLRVWLHRSPNCTHLGRRDGRRVLLSGQDVFHWYLVNELTSYGVPFQSATFAAADVARQAADQLPTDRFLVVRTAGGVSEFTLTSDEPNLDRPALVLPIRGLAEVLIDDAKAVYLTAAT